MMSEILILKFIHNLLFVYWLGGDLGVFYSSKYVVNPDISVESRRVAARIMFWLDQAPRLCMTLILPVGVQLSSAMGMLQISTTGLILIWVISIAWLLNVVILHGLSNHAVKKALETIDFWFRVALIGSIMALSIYALITDKYIPVDWVAVKLLIFALLVGCGLLIRIFLRPFIPAFASMIRNGATAEGNAIMIASLQRCRYVVAVLWIGLLANAAIGVHLIHF